MINKKNIIGIYLAIFLICAVYCSTNISPENQSEFDRQIEMYRYQLDYTFTYSPDFSNKVLQVDEPEEPKQKVAYLTFDDGPTPRTSEILDILKEHNIKATFFVIRNKDEYTSYMKRAAEEGHTVAVHSSSHKYKEIYRSVDDYLEDFTRCFDYIYDATGIRPTIFRFPGGSVNNYNSHSRRDIVAEMTRRGFVYFDWNVESGDSRSGMSADTIYNNVIKGCKNRRRRVIIMHDSINKKTTVEALKRIIPKLKEDGWSFAALDNEVKPMIFKMK